MEDEVKDTIQNVKDSIQDKAEELSDSLKEKASSVIDDVKETAEGLAEEAQQIKEELNTPKTNNTPAFKLPTSRGLLKWIFLGIITLYIYNLVILTKMSGEINTVASRYDGKSTMNFLIIFFLLGPITLGIATLVWIHRLCNRLGAELNRRGIDFKISAGTFWGWCVLGSLLFGVGPFIFIYKFCKGFNLMNADYNAKG